MKQTLRQRQSQFAKMVGILLPYIYSKGYEVTLGDAFAKTGHSKNSCHYIRLAIDLNLFKDGKYLTHSKDHKMFGIFWESIGGSWGGRFNESSPGVGDGRDGNHYSLTWNGRR